MTGEPPFLVQTPSGLDGLSVRVWAVVARDAGLPFVLHRVPTVDAAVAAVAEGRADVAVGPISITSKRARIVSFSLPYYSTTLCIGITPTQTAPLLSRFVPLLYDISIFAGVLFLLLFVVGNLIWYVERHRNSSSFPREYWAGIGNGMWLAVVTMTGVGYGDTVPITASGRLIATTWMLFTLVTASTLTASITSVMTEYRMTAGAIDTPAELAGRLVAVPSGSSVADYVSRLRGHVVPARDLSDAAAMLYEQKVEAIVYHKAEMRYYVRTHPRHPLILSPVHEARAEFGFVLPHKSSLGDPVDVALLQLAETGDLARIEDMWLAEVGGMSSPPAMDLQASPAPQSP